METNVPRSRTPFKNLVDPAPFLSDNVDSVQLTKDIIMGAAMEILDEYGLQDLTIRRLARHLDAAAGAMYWHFPSKQALLGAVADQLLAPLSELEPTGNWRTDVSAFASALHECLTSHRDGAEVVSAGLATDTVSVRPASILVPLLSDAPIGEELAVDAAATLVYFILGSTVDEQTAAELAKVADHPTDSSAHGRRIRHGVDLIIAGIAAGDS